MSRKPAVTIVGPGSLGGALAMALHAAGYAVPEIVYHQDQVRASALAKRVGAKAIALEQFEPSGQLMWICVPDAQISQIGASMARSGTWNGKTVFHSSGALTSEELGPFSWKGAAIASVHPMMSFVRGSTAKFKGVAFALEGNAGAMKMAAQIAKDLGGTSFELKKEDKPLYHALGAFSSPMMMALFAAAERIGRELGLSAEQTREVTGPILRKTLENYLQLGSAGSLSGPLTRGDAMTVRRNLEALVRVPGAAEIYKALARVAVEDLPVKNQVDLKKALSVRKPAGKKRKRASA